MLEKLLATYLAAGDPDHPGDFKAAQRHHALRLMGDFMGYWLLAMDGRLTFVPDDAMGTIEPVRGLPGEVPGIHVALAMAGRRYPDLFPFCPKRTAEEVSCTFCDGSGQIPGLRSFICACGGLGWLPASIAG